VLAVQVLPAFLVGEGAGDLALGDWALDNIFQPTQPP
jgi:hypothetical protein